MRYYRIEVTDSKGNAVATYTSFDGLQTDPGALNVEMDIPVAPFATPVGNAFVRVWGIGIQEISQAKNLNGMQIRVYGGMQAGLPLANPSQAGLLVQGIVFQAFANWIGTDMTLDLIITTGGTPDNAPSPNIPQNIVVNWKANTPLAAAIQLTLSTAYPKFKTNVNISTKLLLAHDEPGFFGNIYQFASYVKGVSHDIIGGTYQGVDIVLQENTFNVYDGTTQKNPKQIEFTDLIGQPTWIAANTIQLNCVMRGDLSIDDYISMPTALVTTSSQSYSQYRQSSIFSGAFHIIYVRHIGNYRVPDGAAWITTINAVPSEQQQ